MSNRDEHNQPLEIEEKLRELYQAYQPEENFVNNLEKRIQMLPRNAPEPGWKARLLNIFPTASPAIAWSAVLLVLTIGITYTLARSLSTAENARQDTSTQVALIAPTATIEIKPTLPPRATPASEVAYLPEADFVNIQEVRILSEQVVQYYKDKGLVVSQAVGWDDRTEVWIERLGGWYSLEGAWLELEDGSRLDMVYANHAADPRTATKSYLQFPALPEEVSQASLNLPDGWRVPISLVLPEESQNLAAVNSVVAEENQCAQNTAVRLCVDGAISSETSTNVLLTLKGLQAGIPVQIPLESEPPLLLDPDGQSVKAVFDPFADPYGMPQYSENEQYHLEFSGYTRGTGSATLVIPKVQQKIQLNQSVTINLGEDPQPDQAWEVNIPVQIADQVVILRNARIVKTFSSGLQLLLYSDAINPDQEQMVTLLEPGNFSPALDTYGFGFNTLTRQHEFVFGITRADGEQITGELTFQLTSAEISFTEPLEIPLQLSAPVELAEEPVIVEVSGFTPPPTPTPLPLVDFVDSTVKIQSGQALFTETDGEKTNLYAIAVGSTNTVQQVATLPGKVYAVKPVPGTGEMIYITGNAYRDGFIQGARWYVWTPTQGAPRQILGPLPNVASVSWSADGRYVYYETIESVTGGAPLFPWVLDLACARSPSCESMPIAIPTPPGIHVFSPVWSLSGHSLALSGYDENSSGHNEIFWLDLESSSTQPRLVNITGTPDITEQALAWAPNGAYILMQSEIELNTYALQAVSLLNGEKGYLTGLPFYTASPALSPDGSQMALFGYRSGEGVKLYQLDVQKGTLLPLTSGDFFAHLSYNTNGSWLSFVSGDGAAVQAIELASGNTWVLRSLSPEGLQAGNRVTWTGWAP